MSLQWKNTPTMGTHIWRVGLGGFLFEGDFKTESTVYNSKIDCFVTILGTSVSLE